MKSKSFQRFSSKYQELQRHNQITDISLSKTFNHLRRNKNNGKKMADTLGVSESKYPEVNHPSTEYARIINYSKRENNEYAFIELYNLFSNYMKDILKEMYLLRPKSITQKSNKTLTYSELSEFTSMDELIDYMINDIFRDLESIRSTPKLVKRIIGHTKIQVQQNKADEALMYLNIRHLIIHNDSKVDKDFYHKYQSKMKITVNGKIPISYQLFQDASKAVYDYIELIDQELIKSNFIQARK